MKNLTIFILVLSLLPVSTTIGQERLRLGLEFGNPKFQDWDFLSGTIETRGFTEGKFYLATFLDKEISDGLYVGVGFDALTANESVEIYPIGRGSGHGYHYLSLGPRISKEFFFVKEKFGFEVGVSLPVTFLTSKSEVYVEDRSFQVIVTRVVDQFGRVTIQPVTDVVFSGSRTVERQTSFFIRPEVNLFYNFSEKFRVTLSHNRGYNTGKPLVTRDFDPIVYNGTRILSGSYTASDSFVGNYRSTTIGIEFRPGKKKVKPQHYKPFK
ncbi:hypothetical protein [Algoriphagus namhaensis]